MHIRLLLLLVALLRGADAVEVVVQYYKCANLPECSYFENLQFGLEVVGESFDAEAVCAAHPEVEEAMSRAIQDWDPATSCVTYLRSIVRDELVALKVPRGVVLEDELLGTYASLDAVTASFGSGQFVEGSVWRRGSGDPNAADAALLERKRACLLTALNVLNASRVAEVGFNAGHSAAAILTALPRTHLTSYDLCAWPYTHLAHAELARRFGGDRTRLVCGDSAVTLLEDADLFDAVFVDGSHYFVTALADMRNSRDHIAKKGALVIVDDCSDVGDSVVGLNDEWVHISMVDRAWRHAIAQNIVEPLIDTCGHVGLCFGRFKEKGSMVTTADVPLPRDDAEEEETTCSLARRFLKVDDDESTPTWSGYMRELRGRLLSEECASVEEYRSRHWKPPIFLWPEEKPGLANALLSKLTIEPEWPASYSAAVEDALYGPSDTETLAIMDDAEVRFSFRTSRVYNIWHWHVIARSTGVRPEQMRHVLEFGAGTGDLAPAIFALGFTGSYAIYDFAPMLLVQRHFLRKAGIKARIVGAEVNASDVGRRRRTAHVALVSSSDDVGRANLPRLANPSPSLFVGFWSLTEADLLAREKIRPVIRRHSHIALTFWDKFDDIDNAEWLTNFVTRDLLPTHSVCAWRSPVDFGTYYLVALAGKRNNNKTVLCLETLGCTPDTKHPTLPSSC